MTVNDFIKAMQREFGNIGYRATELSTGLVWDKGYPEINENGNWHKATPSPAFHRRKK